MRYAQIVADRVHGVFEYDPLPEFAPNIVMIELPEGSPVAAGWRYDGAVFSEPEPEPVAADWPALIAARRYEAEVGGIEIAGMHIATDDRSKLLINGAESRASRNPDYVLNWKTPGGFVLIPAAHVLMIADAVADHVQACFDREAELLAAVSEGGINSEMLEEGWPS